MKKKIEAKKKNQKRWLVTWGGQILIIIIIYPFVFLKKLKVVHYRIKEQS